MLNRQKTKLLFRQFFSLAVSFYYNIFNLNKKTENAFQQCNLTIIIIHPFIEIRHKAKQKKILLTKEEKGFFAFCDILGKQP